MLIRCSSRSARESGRIALSYSNPSIVNTGLWKSQLPLFHSRDLNRFALASHIRHTSLDLAVIYSNNRLKAAQGKDRPSAIGVGHLGTRCNLLHHTIATS